VIFVGTTDHGFFRINTSPEDYLFKVTPITAGSKIDQVNSQSFFQDDQHHLWVTTLRSGLIKIINPLKKVQEKLRFEVFNLENGLETNSTKTVFQDFEGNIWVGTSGKGLSMLMDEAFSFLTFNASEKIEDSPVYKAVFEVLELIDVQQQIIDNNIDQYENNEGLRNVTQFGKEAYMSGGLASLPTYIRQYLSTITMPYTDAFGNEQLESGEKLVIPINSFKTYNGIIKSVKNETDPLKILQRMYTFSGNNPNTKAAVESIFNDIGINYHDVSEIADIQLPQQIKNPLLFNQITKGFTNYKVNWIFLQQDNTNEVISFSAAERDDTHTQNELWGQAYTTKSLDWKINKEKKKVATRSVNAIYDELIQP